MNRPCLALALLSALGLAFPIGAAAEPKAVVELFTSQGCSSCPPADKLLGDLAADGSVVALSLPIDYWDYLGWKDTLAQPRHGIRQRGYAAKRGDRELYTPQAVVNGVAQVLGSDRAALEAAIARTRERPGTLSVPIRLAWANDKLDVSVGSGGEAEAIGEVWACVLATNTPVAIGRGENRGRTVAYHNVVRRWIRLGNWTGGSQSWSLPKSAVAGEGVDRVAVLLQLGTVDHPGMILGAAVIPLP